MVLGSVNAEDALKEFQASPGSFDVVITDFSMPAMSEPRLAQELRQTRLDIPKPAVESRRGSVAPPQAGIRSGENLVICSRS
jgi:CheY-like chemotaxis protein